MIGLVGGLGVGAAVYYYRELAAEREQRGQQLQLVMRHASMSRVFDYMATNDRGGLAHYLAEILGSLKAAGATVGVIPAVTPHSCRGELAQLSPVPIVDLIAVVASEVARRNLKRVALFGTRFVVETDMFGGLGDVEVVRPTPTEITDVHDIYSALARTQTVSLEHRANLVSLAETMQRRDRVEAIILAGTDLSLIFDSSDTPFPAVDCARLHIDAILAADL